MYYSINASVRTPKVAILVFTEDPYWKDTILRITEWCTGVWGGAYNIVIPTNGKSIDEKFWKILEKYGTDYIFAYRTSIADIKKSNPKKYEEIVKRESDRLTKQFPDMGQAQIDEFIEREVEMSPRLPSEVSEELSQELKHRLSPFYFEDHIVQEKVSNKAYVPFPLTDITKIINHTDVVRVVVPEYSGNKDIELLIYSVFGKPPDAYEETLKKNGIQIEHMSPEIPVEELVDISITRKVDLADYRFREELRKELRSKGKKPKYPSEDFFGISPSATSMLKLGYYTLRDDRSDLDDETVLLIVGDTIEDFCLYLSVSKLNKNVHWIPVKFLIEANAAITKKKFDKTEVSIASTIAHAVYGKIRYGTSQGKIHLYSNSCDRTQLDAYKDILAHLIDDSSRHQIAVDSILICENLDEHLKEILHVIEENNYVNQHTETFVEGKSVGTIPTPKPKNFKFVHPAEHRWITELTIDGYTPPPLALLGESIIITGVQTHPTRISRYGLCYVSPSIGYFGGDIDTNTLRPKLQIVEPFNIFKEYIKEAGYDDLVISDKGGYSSISTEKFGSLDTIGAFLAEEKNRNLLDKFRNSPSNTSEGGEIIELNGRNYIDFTAIEKTLGTRREAIEIVDDFFVKGIFYRGVPLQCNDCRNSEWYALDEMEASFICKRCGSKQLIKHRNLHGAKEPQWFYKLDEVVYQGVVSNMHVPLLTLYRLKKNSKSFLYIPESDVIKGDDKIELDVCCIVDGRIIIGEAKKDAIRQRDITKYSDIAKTLKRYPDEVIFSTFAEDWSEPVKAYIQQNVKNSSILVRKDLVVVPPTQPSAADTAV